MMTGVVSAALEATLRLSVEDTRGQVHEVEQQGELADGNTRILDVFAATIQWSGQRRTVEVEGLDAPPLIGMALMRGHELRVHVKPGGLVTIAAVP